MTRKRFRLADSVTDAEASLIFNNTAHKVIKDVFKHARFEAITYYHTKVLKQNVKKKDA
jgi:hypothetical protein